jgi:hypothetical protein
MEGCIHRKEGWKVGSMKGWKDRRMEGCIQKMEG